MVNLVCFLQILTLQDLTDRYNKAYQEAIENGTGYEIKIENYDPMNPTLQ